ncbi:MAG: PAS domain S-box protein [Phycisphaeraceae bacterium]
MPPPAKAAADSPSMHNLLQELQQLRDANQALEQKLVERDAVERALRENEARYRLLAERISDMISWHDSEGRYRYASPNSRELTGYNPEELVGQSAFARIHPDDIPTVQASHERTLRGEVTGPVAFRKRHRDGSYRWVEVTVRPVFEESSGELKEILCLTRDITERREAEQNLRLIQSAVNQVEEAVLITEAELDRPGPRIVYANPAFTRMSGYTAEEVIGRTPRILQGPRTSRAVLDQLRHQLSRGEPFAGETMNYRKDGSEYMLNWHIAPVRDESGRITHWVSIQRDVTQEKKAEQLARQRQAELAHVGRLSTMGEMASELAHELNQPLAAIANYVQGAKRRLGESRMGQDDLRTVFDRIAGQADRAGQIIRRLRRFVRKREPQRSTVNVNRLVRDVIELIEPEIRHQSVQMQLDLADALPAVAVDAVQIEQVILNLVRNAVEAMEQTPTEARRLRVVSQAEDAKAVVVRVIDHGPGIPEHQLSHIFEPFFTTKQRGMGMGLPISLSITEAHGGRLESRRDVEGGMDFRLVIPAANDDTPSDAGMSAAPTR